MDFERVLVSGASAGLGREFARQVASRCRVLCLVARRVERLRALAAELEAGHEGLRVEVREADLTVAAEREALVADWGGEALDLLVNNAGMGDYGEFAAGDWGKSGAMCELNMVALAHLAHGFFPALRRARGGVLNVSSLGGDLPIPDFAVYAATKAFVTSLSEGLRLEWREAGVRVTALCPGPVRTEFGQMAEREGNLAEAGLRESFYVPAEQVVAEGLRAVERGRSRCYPGGKVRVVAAGLALMPRWLVRVVMGGRPRRRG